MASKNSNSFEENFKKIEGLAQELEDNKIGIDQLVPRLQDAFGALKVCKQVLSDTELKLEEIETEFASLNEEED